MHAIELEAACGIRVVRAIVDLVAIFHSSGGFRFESEKTVVFVREHREAHVL